MSEMPQPVMLTAARRIHHPDKETMRAKGQLYRCKQSGARILRSKFRLIIILYKSRIPAQLGGNIPRSVIGAVVWDIS